MPSVSIIVRSFNNIKYIEKTLRNVLSQKFGDFEIINVDSGSDDGTYEIIKKYNPQKSYRISPENYIPGKVLNEAVKKAEGEIIVFNNSDCVPISDQWLQKLVGPLLNPNAPAATFARQEPRPNARPLVVKDHERAFGDGRVSSEWFHFFSLASAAAHKKLLTEKPFDEKLQYSEDIEWSYRIKQQGGNILYVPEARVEHSHNYSFPELRKRFYNEGWAEGQIFKPETSGVIGRFLMPMCAEITRDIAYLTGRGMLLQIPYGLAYRFIQRLSTWQGKNDYLKGNGKAL